MGSVPEVWYLSGGISAANCIAAYAAKGAASQAASYSNLANPGTYDAAAGSAPTWDTTNGWMFNGSSQYLTTGITNGLNNTWSAICKFSNCTASDGALFGNLNAGSWFFIQPVTGTDRGYVNGSPTPQYHATTKASGVMGFAGTKAYLDGADEGLTLVGGGSGTPNTIYIGKLNRTGGPNWTDAYIQALAFYDTVLSAAQVLAVTNAMNAL
jgi:hypothetical protein